MYKYVKRVADLLIAIIALFLLIIPFVIIATWIKLESRGPFLFKQKRYGKNKEPFECLKFRTMTTDAPGDSATRDLKDAHQYITSSGRILRRLGIDELPQLVNVLKGEMSLIGPRPVVLTEKRLIAEREKYGANAMLPGIGGWAQSNGRDEIDYKTKARLDGEYTQNFGWRMDVSCLWRTTVAIFTSAGFKEGHFGDTGYRKYVHANTKKIPILKRTYRRMFKAVQSKKEAVARDKVTIYEQIK